VDNKENNKDKHQEQQQHKITGWFDRSHKEQAVIIIMMVVGTATTTVKEK
jgi:hypothetical protein